MSITAQELENILKEAFPGGEIKINDLAGDKDHYAVFIEHESFNDLSRVKQHRLVYDALSDVEVHALALQTQAIINNKGPQI